MSLADLTRNSYHVGINASQWLDLCKQWVKQKGSSPDSPSVGPVISETILKLCGTYDADPVLQSYLKEALSSGLLPISVFVASFLQVASSSETHSASTLDRLCRLALDAHYASNLPPIGSLLLLTTPQSNILSTVHDALVFLRNAYSFPPSKFHRLSASASELATLLLSCTINIPHIPTTQAMLYLGEANDILHTVRLCSSVRQALETFALSLSLLIGDDAKAEREAQLIHTMQLGLGRNDVLGSNTEADTVTCSLLLHSLVSSRAGDYGAGSDLEAVALLMGTIRWTSWAPGVFYTQILLAALTCVAGSSSRDAHEDSFFIWKAFVLARLPRLLHMLEKTLERHGTNEHHAMHSAIATILQHSELPARCDKVQSRARNGEPSLESSNTQKPFLSQLIQQLRVVELVDQQFVVTMDPTLSSESVSRLQSEAAEHNSTLEIYLESKLTAESSEEDSQALLDRIRGDPGSHHFFATAVRRCLTAHFRTGDLEILSHLMKILYTHDFALDILSLHLKISDVLFDAVHLLTDYDCETVGDPQTASSHLGNIVLFVQVVLTKFRISTSTVKKGDRLLHTDFLRSSRIYHLDDLPPEAKSVFPAWFKAIFDSSSEGIDDTILRSTRPRTLLQMSATLFSQACIARQENRIDVDALRNGTSYFLEPLLHWTLVGVVHAMLFEIQQRGFVATHPLEVLRSLLLAPNCPRVVLRLCSPNILRLMCSKRAQVVNPGAPDIEAIKSRALQTLGVNTNGKWDDVCVLGSTAAQEAPSIAPEAFLHFPRREIREAFMLARERKGPHIDVMRCLTIVTPTKFLLLFWSELCAAASLGEIETCRRLATFVLVTPRSGAPPLLPLFVHNVLPILIARIDQQTGDVNTIIDLMITVVSTVLSAALHLEWAIQTVCGEQKAMTGQTSAMIARKLASDLRVQKISSQTSAVMLQRLSGLSTFITNFPVFAP
ncbi:mediator complex subunit Med5-domain-containing protein [Pisolithus marmoratus]|nr:mediator complex subunit Med5-domain-containing protein [Pisolithus marmoratus]